MRDDPTCAMFRWVAWYAAIFSGYCILAAVFCNLLGWSAGDVFGTMALGVIVGQQAEKASKRGKQP